MVIYDCCISLNSSDCWLVTVSSSFQLLYFDRSVLQFFCSVAVTRMVSNKCPIIADQVVVMFLILLVTIATTNLLKTPLNLALSAYN